MEKCSCIKNKNSKFILSLFSAIFYIMGQGVLISSTAINVYILSYIHHKDKWVDMQYGNLMMPLMSFFVSLFTPLSGPLENAFGPINILLMGSIATEICLFLFYLQRNIWFFYSITLLSGLGIGISVNIPLKNACFYYPQKKGLISSCIMSFVGISIAIYALIAERLINPEKEGVIDEETEPFYSEEVSKRYKNYFIFAMMILPLETFFSLLFFYKYNPNCEVEENEITNEDKENKEKNENEENGENEEKEELKEVLINNRKSKYHNSFYKPTSSKNIKIALKSFRFWRNILIIGLTPFWILFLQSSYRAYVVMLGVDTKIIYYLGSAVALISCLIGPIWASLVDKFGFQPIMKIIGFISTIMSVYFYFFIGEQLFYIIGLIISLSTLVGIMAAATPHLMEIYGMRYFLTIGGFARLFNEISSFSSALISIILSVFFKNAKDLLFPYQIVFVVGGALSSIALVLIFFENDEKFIYGDENEDIEKEKIFINQNSSKILDTTNSSRTTLNNENENNP